MYIYFGTFIINTLIMNFCGKQFEFFQYEFLQIVMQIPKYVIEFFHRITNL